jgi:hypothetical protein
VLAVFIGDLAPAAHHGSVIGVAQDGEQPGPEVGARLEFLPMGPSLDEGVLDEVVGVGAVVAE